MKLFTKKTLSIICLSLITALTNAKESEISFTVDGQIVKGTLNTADIEKAPVVLLLHGFKGSRHELAVKNTDQGVYSRTAQALAKNGFASLRIDFRGSGESDGQWLDTTFSKQIQDAVKAIDWLKKNNTVDGSRIAIVGWSQGGLIASHAAKERPEVRSVVLWAPVVAPLITYSGLLGADNVTKALSSPASLEIQSTLPWGEKTTLKAAFYHELPFMSTAGAIANYPGPLLVIVGKKDKVVAPQPASGQMLLNYHSGKEALKVFDTNHIWDVFSSSDTLDHKMIPTTVKWLKKHP